MSHSQLNPTAALPRSLLLIFAFPGILQAFMLAPTASILQGIYARESGLALVALGGAVIVVRLFDLCSDILIGMLSDRGAQRGISRKWWIAAGTVVSAVALWFLFRPPSGITILYYGAWFLLANIGWSMVEIPYRSWSLEFSTSPSERTRIVTWIALASILGGMIFFVVGPIGKALGLLQSAELNLEMLGLTAIGVVVLLPPLTLITLLRVPDTKTAEPLTPAAEIPRESLSLVLASVFGNHSLLKLLTCNTIFHLLSGLATGVSMLYLTNYLLLSSTINAVFAMTVPLSLLGIPLWGALARRYDRQRVWAVGLILAGVAYGSFGLLPPNPNIALVATIFALCMFFVLSSAVAAPVIMGDVIDLGKQKFGVERAGLYVSLQSQIIKGVGAFASGTGFIILGWAGFDATKSGADLTPQAVFVLKLVAGGMPALGFILTGALLWFVPIIPHADRKPAA